MRKLLVSLATLVSLVAFSACSTVGANFDMAKVAKIENGKTSQNDIRQMFGKPFKTGVQNGNPVWTYEYDEYRAIGQDNTKDLVVVFDDRGIVKSHQLMANRPIP